VKPKPLRAARRSRRELQALHGQEERRSSPGHSGKTRDEGLGNGLSIVTRYSLAHRKEIWRREGARFRRPAPARWVQEKLGQKEAKDQHRAGARYTIGALTVGEKP